MTGERLPDSQKGLNGKALYDHCHQKLKAPHGERARKVQIISINERIVHTASPLNVETPPSVLAVTCFTPAE